MDFQINDTLKNEIDGRRKESRYISEPVVIFLFIASFLLIITGIVTICSFHAMDIIMITGILSLVLGIILLVSAILTAKRSNENMPLSLNFNAPDQEMISALSDIYQRTYDKEHVKMMMRVRIFTIFLVIAIPCSFPLLFMQYTRLYFFLFLIYLIVLSSLIIGVSLFSDQSMLKKVDLVSQGGFHVAPVHFADSFSIYRSEGKFGLGSLHYYIVVADDEDNRKKIRVDEKTYDYVANQLLTHSMDKKENAGPTTKESTAYLAKLYQGNGIYNRYDLLVIKDTDV